MYLVTRLTFLGNDLDLRYPRKTTLEAGIKGVFWITDCSKNIFCDDSIIGWVKFSDRLGG